jgi:hypothetical protein
MSQVPAELIVAIAEYVDVSTRVIAKLYTKSSPILCKVCGGPGPLKLTTRRCVACESKDAPIGETKRSDLLSRFGQLQDMHGRPVGRRKRKPALDDDRALTPSQRAKVHETGERRLGVSASPQPVQKSIEEMAADRARLDAEMKALTPEAIIESKIAASGLGKKSMTWLDEVPGVEVVESGPWFNRQIRIH